MCDIHFQKSLCTVFDLQAEAVLYKNKVSFKQHSTTNYLFSLSAMQSSDKVLSHLLMRTEKVLETVKSCQFYLESPKSLICLQGVYRLHSIKPTVQIIKIWKKKMKLQGQQQRRDMQYVWFRVERNNKVELQHGETV